MDGVEAWRRAAERLRVAGCSTLAVVGGRSTYLSEPPLQVDLVDDLWGGAGPAGGVLTALWHAPDDVALVIAVDHPDLRTDDLAALVSTVTGGAAPAACASAGGRLHPTVAAWSVRACRGRGTAWFMAGGRSLTGLVEACGGVAVEVAPVTVVDIDTPDDLLRREASIGRDDP